MSMTKEERRIRNSLSMDIGDNTQVIERTSSSVRRGGRRGFFGGGGGAIVGGNVAGGVVEHHNTTGLLDDDHTQYVHNSIDRTITADHSFSGDISFSANPPFAVSSSNLVTNLNADKLDGHDESAFFRLSLSETVTGQPPNGWMLASRPFDGEFLGDVSATEWQAAGRRVRLDGKLN